MKRQLWCEWIVTFTTPEFRMCTEEDPSHTRPRAGPLCLEAGSPLPLAGCWGGRAPEAGRQETPDHGYTVRGNTGATLYTGQQGWLISTISDNTLSEQNCWWECSNLNLHPHINRHFSNKQVRTCGKIASKVSWDPTIKFHCPTAYRQPYLLTVKKENTSLEDDPM